MTDCPVSWKQDSALQVRGHVHKMLGSWLAEFTDLRQQLVQPPWPSPAGLRVLTLEVRLRRQCSS